MKRFGMVIFLFFSIFLGILSTPLPSSASVEPGDCNGDGSVSVAEVQSATNMFLGLKSVDVCVDVDNSGTVSVAKMRKVINGFLGLTPSLVSIAITPAAPSLSIGATGQFTAMGTYSDTTTANLTSLVAWSSSNPSVATIAASGTATAVGAGTATISATLGSVVQGTPLTVSDPAAQLRFTYRFGAISGSGPGFADVAFGNGQFVAVGSENNSGAIATSSDGVHWTARTSAIISAGSFSGVTFGNGIFVTYGSGRTLASSDGINWVSSTPGITKKIAYGSGQFVAYGGSGNVVTSSDGVTWTRTAATGATSGLGDMYFWNDSFVSVNGSSSILTSKDGIDWTAKTVNMPLSGIAYGNNQYVGYNSHIVESSSDGITWTSRTTTSGDLFGGSYAGNLFFVVGRYGEIDASADGINWTWIVWDPLYLLRAVAYGNGKYVIAGGGGVLSN